MKAYQHNVLLLALQRGDCNMQCNIVMKIGVHLLHSHFLKPLTLQHLVIMYLV